MKNNLLLSFSLLLLFNSCATKQTIPAQAENDIYASALQLVIEAVYQEYPDAVGIMAHVEAPDLGLSWSGATGLANRETQESLTPDRPVLIASNTKTYVSASILRLVEMGKLRLDQPIGTLLPANIKEMMIASGYDLSAITVAHLQSHTSGVFDYVNAPSFFAMLENEPTHRWTQLEQIQLAMTDGKPLGDAGAQFSYADTNFSLLAVIIAEVTQQPFYTAIRDLLNYSKNGLNATWFSILEPAPEKLAPLAVQYAGKYQVNSYTLDHSFDLFGGGGIAATTEDLARFSQLLFHGDFFDQPKTLDLIYTRMLDPKQEDPNYYLGLSKSTLGGLTAYGHGGFWGTTVQYIPDLNTSISVFILEKDRGKLRKVVLEELIAVLQAG